MPQLSSTLLKDWLHYFLLSTKVYFVSNLITCILFQAVGPIEGNVNVDEKVCGLSDDRKFSASFVIVASVIEDIGTFAVETLDALDVVEKNQLYQNVSKCVVDLITGIARVVAEWDSMNEAANEIPPILLHMLLKLHGKDFAEVYKIKRSIC